MSGEPDAERMSHLREVAAWPFVLDQPRCLGVAVSGGGDSMALLDLMQAVAVERGFAIRAVSVDHGLRAEARAECAFVKAFCEARGIAHDILVWKGWDGAGNLQAEARKARYGLIAEWVGRTGVDWVALGHTRDDQAETVMMRLARASGVDGLAGMPHRFERDGVVMVRPLLRLGREDLRVYLRARGIEWCEDPSNEDDSFERVRARKVLGAVSDLGVDAETLAAVADNMATVKSALDHYALQEVERGLAVVEAGDVILPERMSPTYPVPHEILRRLFNAAILWVAGGDYPPRASALAEMEKAMAGADRHTIGGCLVTRIAGDKPTKARLRVSREFNAVRSLAGTTDAVWDGRWVLDGPHAPDLQVRALGTAVKDCPDWRETGVPRDTLMASPAVWRDETLIAAPVAGLENGWTASATRRGNFAEFLLSR